MNVWISKQIPQFVDTDINCVEDSTSAAVHLVVVDDEPIVDLPMVGIQNLVALVKNNKYRKLIPKDWPTQYIVTLLSKRDVPALIAELEGDEWIPKQPPKRKCSRMKKPTPYQCPKCSRYMNSAKALANHTDRCGLTQAEKREQSLSELRRLKKEQEVEMQKIRQQQQVDLEAQKRQQLAAYQKQLEAEERSRLLAEARENIDEAEIRAKAERIELEACNICMDAEKNSVMVPCGHCVACYECSLQIMAVHSGTCPACRGPIQQVIRKYEC